ncbi:MAG TPA: tetratricopeptide repeat protein [Terracidiphilus sp.]|nr:tetratricopeptide repeat protein [Terracidiphilus sp.]
MRVKVLAVLWVVALMGRAGSAQNPELFRFTLPPGPHVVGLKVVEQYDRSRIYFPMTDDLGKPRGGERARPLQTLIWYPAEKSGGKPMTVGDYANLMMTETRFGKPDPGTGDGWRAALKPAIGDPMWAVRDAPAASGRFPVFIYAPSFGAMSWENADLCEFLASHGYLVIASTALGAHGRDMTNDVAGINAQAADISFLVGFAQTLPDADVSEVAVGGFSWGGIANLFAAARDDRIGALVCLDGSLRYYPGLVKQAGDVHPEQMTIPLIFFTQGEFTLEDQVRYLNDAAKNQGPSVLNEWTHGDLFTVHMLGMMHQEFGSMLQRNEDVWKHSKGELKADYDREDGMSGYAWMARYTLAFLNAYLKHDATAMDWLKKTPAENGVPKHLLSVDFRQAEGLAPTLEAFRAEVGRKGFDHASEIYASLKKQDADFKIEEQAMEGWGDRLTSDRHLPEAIAILSLNVSLYPDSSDAYAYLGGAYAKAGQKQQAIDSYRKALEKNPESEEAKKRLAELEKADSN